MKIASRLTLLVTAAILVVGAIHAAWSITRALDRIEASSQRALTGQARTMAANLAAAWGLRGLEGVQAMVETVDETLGRRAVEWHARGTVEPGFRRDEAGLTAVVPVVVDDEPRGYISVFKGAAEVDERRRDAIADRTIAAAIMIITCGLVLFGATRVIVSRPLGALSEFAGIVGTGDLSQRVEPRRFDEIGALAVEMNMMATGLLGVHRRIEDEARQRVAAQDALRHADRLKTVGQLTAGFAHELGTPLNVILGRARLITRGRVTGDGLVETAEIIRGQAKRMVELVKDLLTFARRGRADAVQVDLVKLVEHSARLLGPLAKKASVTLDVASVPPSAVVLGNAQALEQVIANLVVNAIHASDTGGRVTLSIAPIDGSAATDGLEPMEGFGLIVEDDGAGMPPDVVDRIFDPFFSTKDVGEGTGLGLSVVYGIVRDHGGEIRVTSEVGVGSTFSLRLPTSVDEVPEPQPG